MKVSALYIYPFKSGPAVAVQHARTTPTGFAHDRRFMVTDTDGVFITQRENPRLGQCRARFDGETFTLDAAFGSIALLAGERPADVRVWDDAVEATRCGAHVEAWFAELLQQPVWVVQMSPRTERASDGHPDDPLNFADAFPYNFATTASLDALNARIAGDDVPIAAFRPNIVIDGSQPWAEDNWQRVRAGGATFECTTNCARCAIPMLDPQHPARPRRDGEPLRSLAKFRKNAQGKVDFARYAIAREHGVVSTGDTFEVLD